MTPSLFPYAVLGGLEDLNVCYTHTLNFGLLLLFLATFWATVSLVFGLNPFAFL